MILASIHVSRSPSALIRSFVPALLMLWATAAFSAEAPEASEAADGEDVTQAMGNAHQIESLTESMSSVVGDWVRTDVVPEISWGQIVLAGLLTVLVFAAERGLSWLLRRTCQRSDNLADEKVHGKTGVLKSVIDAAIPPLSVFIWVWGGSVVLWLLFARMGADGNGYLILLLIYSLRRAANFLLLFWLVYRLIKTAEAVLLAWAGSNDRKWDDVLAAVAVRALRLVVPLLAITLIVPMLDIPAAYHQFFKQGAALVLIGAIGFILYQLANTAEKAVLEQYRIDTKNNLGTRKVQTQVRVLKRVAVVLIIVFTTASMLMVFDSVRQLGTSLLASAGVVGIVIGFAAQRSIASLLAGVQIAFTQPIRLDDVVVLEGEFGRVEEITLTYVVVNIWDSRRLVVPINYFIEKPFQNWTRTSSELLGTVYFHLDYGTPVEPLRQELDRILEKSTFWDRRAKGLQVTDSKERTLEIRVLASAADAGMAWNLRCEIREKMIKFLQETFPDSLPRVRLELVGEQAHSGFLPPQEVHG